MSTNMNTNMETENTDTDLNGVRMSNTNVKPNTSTNVTLIDTSNEQTIEIMEENTDKDFNGATMDDTNVEPNRSMTVTLINNSNEQSYNEEGTDNDMIFTSDEEDNIFDDVVQEHTLGYYDSDNDLQIVGDTRSKFHFNPLTRSSREEVGPLVQITKFADIPYTHIGQELKGLPRFRERMKGDGSCYFRAISFAISGTEEYHNNVRRAICDYIETFPGRLNAVLQNAHDVQSGCEYIQKSEM